MTLITEKRMFNRIVYILSLFVLLSICPTMSAQTLIKTHTYYGAASMNAARKRLGATLVNKPNGVSFRLRIQQDYPNLARPSSLADCEAPISVATSDGFMMLLHREENAFSHQYWCLLYDKDQNLMRTIDLCAEGGQSNCEITDIRYDSHQVMWNFSCVTGASRLDGKCNQMLCYDVTQKKLLWKSPFLTSRGVFTLDAQYIYTGYGFTNEADFVYLLDRQSGHILTQCPVESAPQYLELTSEGLFVEDYRENGYLFKVTDAATLQVTGKTVRLREGPSTDAAIYSVNGQDATYPLQGDLFESAGAQGDFNILRFNDKRLYISKRFSKINGVRHFYTADLKNAGVKAWVNKGEGNFANFEVYDMDKFTDVVELMADEGNDLTTGTTYQVYIDNGKANGVFLSPCGEYGVVLFIMTENGKLFALDMLEATADDGTPLNAIEIPLGNFVLDSLESIQNNNSWTVWAVNADGNRKKVNLANLEQ